MEKGETEETPVKETISEKETFEGVDLSETGRRQGLMTDDEYQSILDGLTGRGENTVGMAEGLDLASKAVGDGSIPKTEEEPPRSVAEVESEKSVEAEPEVPFVQSKREMPTAVKPKIVKRKLVLKDDPRAERQKPRRTSQRCLGQGMPRKAGASTAAEAVEISSEEERVTSTKTEENPIPAANQEEAHEETEVVPPTPTTQEEAPIEEEILKVQVTEPTAQKEPTTSTEKKLDDETRKRDTS